MKLTYRLARPGDDPVLRRLIASTAMEGSLTVAFEREPDFFDGMRVEGSDWQVILAVDEADGELAGMLCRSVQERFVNGAPERVAYWSQLRIAEKYRGSVLMPQGLAFLREVDNGDPVAGGLVVVADGNSEAARAFSARHRRVLPALEPVARIRTFGIALGRRFAGRRGSGRTADDDLEFPDAAEVGWPRIAGFLRARGASRQLYPAYDEAYLAGCGCDPTGFVVAARQGRIEGVAAVWDQSAFRQTVVRAYGGILRAARPLYNLFAPLGGRPPLPGLGDRIRSAYLAFPAVEQDSPEVFSAVLGEACRRARLRGCAWLMAGFCGGDPLAETVRRLPHVPYGSVLYAWGPGSGKSFASRFDGRVPYVEIATL